MPVDLTEAGAVVVLGYVLWLTVTGLVKIARGRNNPGNPNSGKTDTKLNAIFDGQKELQRSSNRIELILGVIKDRLPLR